MRHFIRIFTLFILFAVPIAAFAQWPRVLWQREGQGDSSAYGAMVWGMGDQNNDGFADWAVLGHGGWNSHPGLINERYFELFHGGNPPSTTPYMVFRTDSNLASGYNGWWVVGDVNGDGYIDWYQTNWDRANPSLIRQEFFWGGPQSDSIPDWTWVIDGYSVTPVGDFNGDGYADVASYHWTEDYVQIFFGGNPPDTIPDWTLHSPPGHPQEALPHSFGDLNGDGFDDIITETLDPEYTHFFYGGAHPDTVPAQIWNGRSSYSSAIVNDLNGDGRDDYVFPYISHEVGVHWGSAVMYATADAYVNAPCQGGQYWRSLGDINRDGYNDFAGFDDYCLDSDFGAFGVYLGHPWLYGPARVIWPLTAPTNMMAFVSATGLGDINGDGLNDFIIGAYDDLAYIGWRGKAVVISGDTNLVAGVDDPFILHPSSFCLSCYPNPFNATTTISFTLPRMGTVDLNVYDVTGRLVRQLAGGHIGPPLQAGTHDIAFDGSDLCSGIYFVRMEAGGILQTKKIVLLK